LLRPVAVAKDCDSRVQSANDEKGCDKNENKENHSPSNDAPELSLSQAAAASATIFIIVVLVWYHSG
jgi:hypothetical protein